MKNNYHKVLTEVKKLLGKGVSVPGNSSELSLEERTRLSLEYLENGEKVIYGAMLVSDNVQVYVDVLVRNGDSWDIYLVSTRSNPMSRFIHDLAFASFVLESLGYNTNETKALYLNSSFTKRSAKFSPAIFRTYSKNNRVRSLTKSLGSSIKEMYPLFFEEDEPTVPIGLHCHYPSKCVFKDHCWKEIPDNSILKAPSLGIKRKFELQEKGYLTLDQAIGSNELTATENKRLVGPESLEVQINQPALLTFLSRIEGNPVFLDFEAYTAPIPEVVGDGPYQKIPFLYSIFVSNPNAEGEERDYIIQPDGEDKRRVFAENLIADLGVSGTIFVFSQQLEKEILMDLKGRFPDLAEAIDSISDRIIDLQVVFRKKWIWYPELNNSDSLKKILPLMVHEMDFSKLDINEGGVASMKFMELVDNQEADPTETLAQLKAYCNMDTYAMFRIYGRILELADVN